MKDISNILAKYPGVNIHRTDAEKMEELENLYQLFPNCQGLISFDYPAADLYTIRTDVTIIKGVRYVESISVPEFKPDLRNYFDWIMLVKMQLNLAARKHIK